MLHLLKIFIMNFRLLIYNFFYLCVHTVRISNKKIEFKHLVILQKNIKFETLFTG